jgi:Tfp pilus assembly protein PilW
MFAALESRTTNTKPRRNCHASTLIEVLISMLLVGLVLGAVLAISLSSGRSFAEIMNYIDLDRDNRIAVDKLTRDVRQMAFLSIIETNALTFVDLNGSPVRYEYSPASRLLVRTSNGQQTTMLTECDSLVFAAYERAPLTNTFVLNPATEATNCKVVSLSWSCSRSMLGLRRHKEAAQTARIVLRNKQT